MLAQYCGGPWCPLYVWTEKCRAQGIVTEEMKATLLKNIGTGLPLQIKNKNAEVQTVFVRGFADESITLH